MQEAVRSWLIEHPLIGRLVRRMRYPRSVHVFCVGAPKTGTSSIAGLFQKNFRAEHEPHVHELLSKYEEYKKETGLHQFDHYLHQRDVELWLEVESSWPTGLMIEALESAFPEAKFILTVRDPLSWLKSIIGQHLKYPVPVGTWEGTWPKLRDICFIPDKEVRYCLPEEKILKKLGLYSLRGYLKFWTRHNQRVINAVEDKRLLVIRTRDISKSVNQIAHFLDVAPDKIDKKKSHLNKKVSNEKIEVMNDLEKKFVLRKISEECGEVRRMIEKNFNLKLSSFT